MYYYLMYHKSNIPKFTIIRLQLIFFFFIKSFDDGAIGFFNTYFNYIYIFIQFSSRNSRTCKEKLYPV